MHDQNQVNTFSGWLHLALELVTKRVDIWLVYVFLSALLLGVGRISLGLGVFLSVSCFFVGVSLAEYIDNDQGQHKPHGLVTVIKAKLPLIMSLAVMIVLCWFGFRVIYNIYTGEYEKIFRFFFHWELVPDNYADKNLRQMSAWFYSAAIVALLFVLMMFSTYASWFSYPLMAFKDLNWVQAKRTGNLMAEQNKTAMRKLIAFVVLLTLLGLGVVPLLTPVVYMIVSMMMYASYKTCIKTNAEQAAR